MNPNFLSFLLTTLLTGLPVLAQVPAEKDDGPQWSYKTAANGTADCCSPVVDGDFVFASSVYGTGGGLVKVTAAGDHQQAAEV